jgi:hypothetical protein
MKKPTDKEVGAAMKFYAEHGYYPLGTPPQVIEMAEKLKAAAEEIMQAV